MIAPSSDWPEQVIELRGLTRRFGRKHALNNVSMSVPRGVVVGLVGANGAGKTTLIRHVLGLLKAQQGSVRVFGLDPVADPVGVLSRVGYLSEENDLPGWMRIDELMRYTRATSRVDYHGGHRVAGAVHAFGRRAVGARLESASVTLMASYLLCCAHGHVPAAF